MTVFERRNNVSLSALNQRRSFTLKQHSFWAGSKKVILFIYHDAWKIKIFISTLKRWPYFNVETTSVYQLNQSRNLMLKQRWFWVNSKKILSLTILQSLRTAILNDICSDLICLQTVLFSWYFMKVFRKWSEEMSIFSKLQVYKNIHESFSFPITLKDDFCNNVILQIFSPM